jgi:hypothetical protein
MNVKLNGLAKVTRAVTPVEAGVQKWLLFLDSGFRRNDGKGQFLTFYERVKLDALVKSRVHPSIPQGERLTWTVTT